MNRRQAAVALTLAMLGGPLAAGAAGQQRVDPAPPPRPGERPIDQAVVDVAQVADYAPDSWETPSLAFPMLAEEAVVAVSEDAAQLKFVRGNELGSFRPAPEGGSAFFGQGRPIFGVAAPPILPSRILRPLGTGDAGDRFLGAPPAISDETVIPKIGQTFDDSRQSFAFLNGPPASLDTGLGGSPAFPLLDTVLADPNGPDLPDNVPGPPEEPTPPSTVPPSEPPVTFRPGPSPTVTTPRPTVPVTVPPPGTTIPRPATTSTSAPTTTTSTSTTTTSTTSTTTTTTTTPTTTTTTTPPSDPIVEPPVSFVLGNQREAASFCLSNATGGTTNSCDRLLDLSGIRPGVAHKVNLTLWNVHPDSQRDAVDLRVFAGSCTSGTNGPAPHGSGNLCDGLQLKIERYATAARDTASTQCVYGCGASAGGTLSSFVASHGSATNGITIGNGFARNEKAYLILTVLLPDTGSTTAGRGKDNKYLARTANLQLTWQMTRS